MEHPIWVTIVINKIFGAPALALLHALHIHPASTKYPIPGALCMEFLVFILSIIFFLWLKPRISADRPGAMQQVMEGLITNPMGLGAQDLINDNIGPEGIKYLPMLGSIGLWVLFCNLIGVVPTLEVPTAAAEVPLGCAVLVFVYYNYCGVSRHGPLGHAKHFLGPDMPLPRPIKWVLSTVLMLPVEIISNFARLLSLTVRLWANMLASELLYGIFLGLMLAFMVALGKLNPIGYVAILVPLIGPTLFIALHLFEALIQAFVFTILPVIYVAGAIAEQH